MNLKYLLFTLVFPLMMNAQNVMTPETLWTLNKLSVSAIDPSQSSLIYDIGKVDLKTEKTKHDKFLLNLKTGTASSIDLGKKSLIQWDENGMYAKEDGKIYLSKNAGNSWEFFYEIGEVDEIKISPDAKIIAFSKAVQMEKLLGKDKYSDVPKSTAQIYTDLNNRHWDSWNEGFYNHVFVVDISKNVSEATDLLTNEMFDSPQKPFGGSEDFLWTPDSSKLLYVSKKKSGAEYAQCTNTDIYAYDLQAKTTENLTKDNLGYDVNPKFSPNGQFLSWQSMERDGYEADKNRIMVMDWKTKSISDLTKNWDESATGDVFWDKKSSTIYFNAAFRGTNQLFSVNLKNPKVMQISQGNFDVTGIVSQSDKDLLVTRTDFNHNADLFSVNLKNGEMKKVTDVNKENYAKISPSTSELKMIKTTDGKEMGVWMIYPPNFDPSKKYPTLLYCQGGPQSALSQFFSVRWNFALMAANGYIIVAPNRRGMPGWGTQWNEDISKDWGGQPMNDYLSAADFAKTLPYVDGDRMGAVGASYGGYSVFMLAGIHQNRFKTFIAHDGLFDMKSWYGTTEELFFANWDLGAKPSDFHSVNTRI
jgi:dipeptidyl aminopeptidase/acylaminoacyl peptidase